MTKRRRPALKGMSRMQAMLEELTRHCELHWQQHKCLPPVPTDINIESIQIKIKKHVKFRAEWYTQDRNSSVYGYTFIYHDQYRRSRVFHDRICVYHETHRDAHK